MNLLDGARTEFDVTPTTAVTKVERTPTTEELLARKRRPEDSQVESIVLRRTFGAGQGEAAFSGRIAWALADLTLAAWADTLRAGRVSNVEFFIRWGDTQSYRGRIEIARGRRRPKLADYCRRVEVFRADFCPSATEKQAAAMLLFFLSEYQVGDEVRSRRATPEPQLIAFPTGSSVSEQNAPSIA